MIKINNIEYYNTKEVSNKLKLSQSMINFLKKLGKLKYLKINEKISVSNLEQINEYLKNKTKIIKIYPKINITNEIINKNNHIIYNETMYYQHPKFKDYYFNQNNIKNYIKQYGIIFKLMPVIVNKKENKEIIQITSKFKNEKNKNRILVPHAKLILETSKYIEHNKYVCSHYNDVVSNNNIENLTWATQKENCLIYGLNTYLNKKIIEHILLIPNKNIINEILNKYKSDFLFPNTTQNLNTILINNTQYLKVPIFQNVYIDISGTSIIQLINNIPKYLNIYLNKTKNLNKRYFFVFFNKKRYKVHQLMAWSKYGYFNYTEKTQCLHLNDIRSHNHYINIIKNDSKINAKNKSDNIKKYKDIRKNFAILYPDVYKNTILKIYSNFDNNEKNSFKLLPIEKILNINCLL